MKNFLRFLNPFATISHLKSELFDRDLTIGYLRSSRDSWAQSYSRTAAHFEQLFASHDALDQAIDAFMDERRELLDRLILASNVTDILAQDVDDRDEEIESLNQVLNRASTFVGRSRELLATMGITIEVGDNDEPSLTINMDELANMFRGTQDEAVEA